MGKETPAPDHHGGITKMHSKDCPNQIRTHRVAIFRCTHVPHKYAIVACTTTAQHNVIGIDDPTADPVRRHLSYETPELARKHFDEMIIASVSDHGANLVYNGARNLG
jgi:hypothetical protein